MEQLSKTNLSLPFDTNVLLIIAMIGVVIKYFMGTVTSKDGSTGPASATVWGYGLTTMAFLGMVVIIIALSTRDKMDLITSSSTKEGTKSVFYILWDVLKVSFPIVATIVILAWVVMINFVFMERINKGKVAPEFGDFSFISTILIFLQVIVVFKYLLNKLNLDLMPSSIENETLRKANKLFNTEATSVTIILTLLNLIFVGMMQVVVEFFSTDG